MRKLIYPLLFIFLVAPAVQADNGLISVKSAHDVKTTADRLEGILASKGMKIFARIDHAKGAASVGNELRPTELIIFGNPKIGSVLMKCAQSTGVDLPQKALVWKDQEGTVWLSYNDPSYLAQRHQISGCDKVLSKVTGALAAFASKATAAAD